MTLSRVHATRLRALYRSAGWPSQDKVEVELLAAGLLERVCDTSGHETVKLTDAGIDHLALAFHTNRQARSAHDALVGLVAQTMIRDGRIVWTGLSLRAQLPPVPDIKTRWKMCIPDVFSIRNTTLASYLDPVVHEIKVSRADLLGDLKSPDKRASYLDVGGQCWYVLGCNSQGKPIAKAEEIPTECGVMIFDGKRLDVVRNAPKREIADLPFPMWMALAKAAALRPDDAFLPLEPCQPTLTDQADGDRVTRFLST